MARVTDELERLASLYKEGLLTREEFEVQKRALLGDSSSGATPPPSSTPAAPVGSDELTGQRIGEYRLERKLGEGGMGTVYLAAHQALGQHVAVKVLDPTLARSPEVRERFLQEARIQIGLRHPGIVQVLTANTLGDHLALVMEYVDGLSLAQVIERRRVLPVDEALGLFRQVLDAVGHAHAHGVVHRDIKPSNIMVQADGTAKVMDFGIAKVVGGDKLTRTGTVMGSAHYMSPEQVLGQSDIDLHTDIYSLGITFYEVLTGRTPFEGLGGDSTDSDFMIKLAHKEQKPPDPHRYRADVPTVIAEALLKALDKKPGSRFPTTDAFGTALESAPVTTPSFMHEPGPVSSSESPKNCSDGPNGKATNLCPSCGSSFQTGDCFCTGCGSNLRVEVDRCTTCRAVPQRGDRFCAFCGAGMYVWLLIS